VRLKCDPDFESCSETAIRSIVLDNWKIPRLSVNFFPPFRECDEVIGYYDRPRAIVTRTAQYIYIYIYILYYYRCPPGSQDRGV